MQTENSLTKYGFNDVEKKDNDLVSVSESRAMHEVQAAFFIAKKFPRNQDQAFANIMKSCKRQFLAEQAIYAYPRGGKLVEGASIRLAEVLLMNWGNCEAGIREISQSNGMSIAEAYAIDFETNTRIAKIFHASHRIGTKNGIKILTEPRDIYLEVANQGARRMRSCILAIVPGDIVDAAMEQCKETLKNGSEPIADRIRKLTIAFDELGVKVEHLEKRLGHKLDSTIDHELITLRGIYKSLKDGMASREDFFDLGLKNVATNTIEELLDGKSKGKEALKEIKDKLQS
jgi:hypothetical protein